MWLVCHFIKDNSVEVVPESWIINKQNGNKECLWPLYTNRSKLYDVIKNRASPECNWKSFNITILGRYEKLEIAQKKCEKARETDELSSTSEIFENRRKKKQVRHGDYVYDYDPDMPRFPLSAEHTVSDSEEAVSDSDIEESLAQKNRNTRKLNVSTNMSNEPKSSLSQRSHRLLDTEFIENETGEKRLYEKRLEEFINKSYEFQKLTLKELFIVKCIVKENKEIIGLLIRNENNNADNRDDTVDKNFIQDLMKKFPLRFSEDLEDIEQQLENDSLLNALVQELALLGGDCVKDVTIRLMYFLLSNKLGAFYSWEGQKGKKKFKTLKLATVVMRTVRQRHPATTDTEIVTRIKNWLVQAKFRENLKEKKKEQKNQNLEDENNL